MPRLIDADMLYIKVMDASYFDNADEDIMLDIVNDAPSIDPVHAAGGCYCGECEYRTKDTQWTRAGFCGRRDAGSMMIARPDDFCSRGKRREENDTI